MHLIWEEQSWLIDAVCNGRLNAVRSFLDSGVNLNSYNVCGFRLLNLTMTMLRLPRGPVKTTPWSRAIHVAVEVGADVVLPVLEADRPLDIAVRDDAEDTALHVAMHPLWLKFRRRQIVRMLLAAGAPVRV
ncbi:hypothetical protein TSTA_062650 [Talaromyces stipitatus ATCC 10500]|uniref:Ankyrin repeat-containing protein n=1 Tax=Talaromyces stipitatus (strain ATCC 10500 / CBS 375.48 / QM 6759 / NRRL 1006) TaxID=441959 RepID=B8LXW3_TALSN|nr:uncharacterized protein TSTA_062650 [Talaromyces stipitatus ATCC 10500]EED22778.1 hypothetical protein TSTA_062650 [Talaromyces stipitatus ATCC 10500]